MNIPVAAYVVVNAVVDTDLLERIFLSIVRDFRRLSHKQLQYFLFDPQRYTVAESKVHQFVIRRRQCRLPTDSASLGLLLSTSLIETSEVVAVLVKRLSMAALVVVSFVFLLCVVCFVGLITTLPTTTTAAVIAVTPTEKQDGRDKGHILAVRQNFNSSSDEHIKNTFLDVIGLAGPSTVASRHSITPQSPAAVQPFPAPSETTVATPTPYSTERKPFNSETNGVQPTLFRHPVRLRRSIRKTAVVGGSVILECDIPYPPGFSVGAGSGSSLSSATGSGSSHYQSSRSASVSGFSSQLSSLDRSAFGVSSTGPAADNSIMIKWHKQGIEVPIFIQLNRLPAHVDANYNGRIRLLDHSSGSVEITGIRPKDDGWYECSVVFLQRTDDSNPNGTWVYLAVTAKPELGPVSPAFQIVREGDTAEMFCQSTGGIPAPTLSWLKDGRKLQEQALMLSPASSRLSMHPAKGVLTIRNVVNADSGVYTCLFENQEGHVSHSIRLVVKEPGYIISPNAYILMPPKNTTALEGTRVRLQCQAEAHPSNISYQWYRDGVDVHHVTGLMSRAGIYADGSFIISSVMRDDTGLYRCQPSNGIGPPPSAEAFLNVTYLPRVVGVQHAGQVYLVRSLPGRLDCPADANPPVVRVVWSKDDRPFADSQGPILPPPPSVQHTSIGGHHAHGGHVTRGGAYDNSHQQSYHSQQHHQRSSSVGVTSAVRITRRGSLVFKAAMPADSGVYSCTPYSTLGKGQPSPAIHVFVKDAPYFVVFPRPIYQRHVGQSVSMPCVADGDPKPTVEWRKGDGAFPVISKAMNFGGNLSIPNLNKNDQGTYECVATNVVTSVIVTTLLLIEVNTAPHAPYNLSVRTTHREAKVSWRPAYDGGHSLHYVLWYKQNDNQEEWQTLHVVPREEPATSMTIHNLQPGTAYRFMVLARNKVGEGMFSSQVTMSTKGDLHESEENGEEEEETSGDEYEDGEETEEEEEEGEEEEEEEVEEEEIEEEDEELEEEPAEGSADTTPEYLGPRPDPPVNVSVRIVPGEQASLKISWFPPPLSTQHHIANDHTISTGASTDANHYPIDRPPNPSHGVQLQPVTHYVIEYRTVGQWVPLGQRLSVAELLAAAATAAPEPSPTVKPPGGIGSASTPPLSFTWKTASRGAIYHFRVRSSTENGIESAPSQVATVQTIEQTTKTSSIRASDVTLAGAAAAVLLVFVIVIGVVVFRIRRRRKRRAIRYDTVKYFGPNQIDTAQTIDRIPEGLICAIAENEPITTTLDNHENHVTVLPPPPHLNHHHVCTTIERKKIQETPI